MKVAVTYDLDSRMIFQHFGETQYFKIYTIEDGKIVDKIVLDCDGKSHTELVDLLADRGINAIVCGGLGFHAVNLLESQGITVYAHNMGDADEIMKDFVEGEISPNNQGHQCGCGCH